MVYRVLYLDHAAEMGGAEFSLAELILALKARQVVEPVVATAAGGDFARYLEQRGISVLPLQLSAKARHFSREKAGNILAILVQFFYWRKSIKQLQHWLRENPVDLIHSNTLKMHGLSGFLGKDSKMPLVWHMRDIPSHRGNADRIIKAVSRYHSPAGIIAISDAVRESLQGIQASRFTLTIHNGLDLSQLLEQKSTLSLRAEVRERFGLPQDARLIVSVGYFIPWKGQDTLIAAFSKVHAQYPDTRLVLIGRPIFQYAAEQKRLEEMAAMLGVAHAVYFLGEQLEIVSLLPAFDVFVCPSTREPFGRVILEAMAAGIPIVATAAGGIPEIVSDEKEALLVPPTQPQAMADAINRLLTDTAFGDTLVNNAKQRLTESFSLEKTVDKVFAAYKRLFEEL
jgi:L-malate glycosyltransferase